MSVLWCLLRFYLKTLQILSNLFLWSILRFHKKLQKIVTIPVSTLLLPINTTVLALCFQYFSSYHFNVKIFFHPFCLSFITISYLFTLNSYKCSNNCTQQSKQTTNNCDASERGWICMQKRDEVQLLSRKKTLFLK